MEKEKIWLFVIMAQKLWKTVGGNRANKERKSQSPAERNHMGMGAVEKDMLLICSSWLHSLTCCKGKYTKIKAPRASMVLMEQTSMLNSIQDDGNMS